MASGPSITSHTAAIHFGGVFPPRNLPAQPLKHIRFASIKPNNHAILRIYAVAMPELVAVRAIKFKPHQHPVRGLDVVRKTVKKATHALEKSHFSLGSVLLIQ